jgi:hypothetical protein
VRWRKERGFSILRSLTFCPSIVSDPGMAVNAKDYPMNDREPV